MRYRGECGISAKIIYGSCKIHYHDAFRNAFWVLVGFTVFGLLLTYGIIITAEDIAYENEIIESLDCIGLRSYLADNPYSVYAENRFKWLCIDAKEMQFNE